MFWIFWYFLSEVDTYQKISTYFQISNLEKIPCLYLHWVSSAKERYCRVHYRNCAFSSGRHPLFCLICSGFKPESSCIGLFITNKYYLEYLQKEQNEYTFQDYAHRPKKYFLWLEIIIEISFWQHRNKLIAVTF